MLQRSCDRYAAAVSAGVNKKTLATLQTAIDRQRVAFGQVLSVWTDAKVRKATVNSVFSGNYYAFVKGNIIFEFPPNVTSYEAELMRAQSEGLRVGVGFTTDNNGVNTIDSVFVASGGLEPPRY